MKQSIETYKKNWTRRVREAEQERATRYEEACDFARRCSQLLKERYQVTGVYLIGSLLRQKQFDLHSDIDLVVKGLDDHDYVTAYGDCRDMAPSSMDIDLIPYEDAKPKIKRKVEEKGKEI